MKKLLLLLVFLLACSTETLLEKRIDILGYWKYIGEAQMEEINILQIKDSVITYFLESTGIYSFRYDLKSDSLYFILSESNEKKGLNKKGIQFKLVGKDTLILLGAKIDTLNRVPEELGKSLVERVKSGINDDQLFVPNQ